MSCALVVVSMLGIVLGASSDTMPTPPVYVYPGSSTCAGKTPITVDSTLHFRTGTVNGWASEPNVPKNSQGGWACFLGTTMVNSAWFTLHIAKSGYVQFYFDSYDGVDLDYVLWGPFSTGDPSYTCGAYLANSLWSSTQCGFKRGPSTMFYINTEPFSLESSGFNATAGTYYTLLVNDNTGNTTFRLVNSTASTPLAVDRDPLRGPTSMYIPTQLLVGQVGTVYAFGYLLSSGLLRDQAKSVPASSDCTAASAGTDFPGTTLGPGNATELNVTVWNPKFLFSGTYQLCYLPYNRTAFVALGAPFFVNDTRPIGAWVADAGVPDPPQLLTTDWIDFGPRTGLTGELVEYTFTGFRVFGLSSALGGSPAIWAKVVVTDCHETATEYALGYNRNASIRVDVAGVWKVCIKYRMAWEPTSGYLVITTPDPAQPFFGYSSCGTFLAAPTSGLPAAALVPNTVSSLCGCFYAAPTATAATVPLPLELPFSAIFNSPSFTLVDQGCCVRNTLRRQSFSSSVGVWGWCSDL
eukprot:RCo033122